MGSRFQFHHQLVFLFPCREETRRLQLMGGHQFGAATAVIAQFEQLQLVWLSALEHLELGDHGADDIINKYSMLYPQHPEFAAAR
jgi:hypothetical protein